MLCRVCGKKLKPNGYKLEIHARLCQLSLVLGFDISLESSEDVYIPSPVVCHRRYATLKELEKAKKKGIMRETS